MTEKDKAQGTDIELSVKVMGFQAAIKASNLDRFFGLVAPNYVAESKVLQSLADNIERHLAAGRPLSELPPAEQCLVGNAVSHQVKKFANRVAIKERAAELFGAPPRQLPEAEESSAASQSNQAKAEHAQYFWERFWADADVATVPYVKEVYAQVMAGQLRKPGRFSLRTLDVLRYLDEDVAQLFHRIRGFVVMWMALPDLNDELFGEDRLYHIDFLRLAEAGLVQGQQSSLAAEFGRTTPIVLADALCKVHPEAPNPNPPDVYALTKAGHELHSTFDPDDSKRDKLLDWFKREMGRIVVNIEGTPTQEWKPTTD